MSTPGEQVECLEPGAGVGIGALEDGSRVDFSRLRAHRRQACVGVMADHDLDALVLGREANVRAISGARRYWTEGVRPYSPACVAIAATKAVHLLSSWDDGIPHDPDPIECYPMTWNGAHLARSLGAIAGLGSARRIGVDAMTPGAARLLAAVSPRAELVDVSGALLAARRHKTPDEVRCIRTAVAAAEAGLSAAWAVLGPGSSGRALAGRAIERMAQLGVTTVDTEGRFELAGPPRSQIGPGLSGLVAGEVGALYAGYQGVAARSWVVPGVGGRAVASAPQRRLFAQWQTLHDHLVDALRPGERGQGLLDAYRRAGEALPERPIAHGMGLGMEPPLIGAGLPADAGAAMRLEPGMVLFVVGQVSDPSVGTIVAGDAVLVTGDGCEILSHFGHGPLAESG